MLTMGCADNDPCADTPNSIFCPDGNAGETGGTGETGEDVVQGCVPNLDGEPGYAYECQGSGNGWMVLNVFGKGNVLSCANYGDGSVPSNPDETDCIPFDLSSDLPGGVPNPGACCTEDALSVDVAAQCQDDCGWAACKIAVEKIREAANSLSNKPFPEGPIGEANAREDLFYLANLLEMPTLMEKCANLVTEGAGELVEVNLGAGITNDDLAGHIINSNLYLQCSIDAMEPFVPTTDSCDATPNIVEIEEESSSGGVAAAGAVSLLGPNGEGSSSLHDITFDFTERYGRDGSVTFILTGFSAEVDDATYGGFGFSSSSLRLASSASGTVSGETVTFPVGSIRMSATSVISVEGEPMFDGAPMTNEYTNTAPATATRTRTGTFEFVDAEFEVQGYVFTLNTEAGTVLPQ